MGRTIRSATQTWVEEEKALTRYVRALRKSDQALISELIALSRSHIAEASYASNLYPMDIYLVSMLLELYKKVAQLKLQLEKTGVLSEEGSQETRGPASLLELVIRTDPHPVDLQANTEPKPLTEEYIDFQEGA